MTWVNKYVKEYYDWLKEKTFIQEDSNNDWAVINTPFIGAFNDGIDIYAKIFGDKVRLSDNGETFNNLELLGVNIQGSKNRRSILDSILLNYGLKEENDELVIDSKLENFSQSKHNFLAGILEINDLYYLSKANVNSIFKEDVRNYLDEKQIIFTPDFISKGETGLEFTFDFQLAKRNSETVIKSFNSISKSNLPSFLFAWEDIKPVREKITKKEVNAIAIINDINKDIKLEFLEALESKHAKYILWSEKDEEKNIELLQSA